MPLKKMLFFSFWVSACLTPGEPPPAPPVVQVFSLPSDGSAPPLLSIPFPSDLYQEEDGTLIDLPGLERVSRGANISALSRAYGRMNGFGLTTGAFFLFSGEIDPSSLTSQTAGLVDIDPSSPQQGAQIEVDVRFDAPTKVLSLVPKSGVVLREKNRYAAYLQGPLLDTQGRPVQADESFLAALRGSTLPSTLSRASALLRPAAEALVSQGILPSTDALIGLTVYTTQHITKDLVAIREMLDDPAELLAPQIQFPEPALIFDTRAELDALLGDSQEILGRDQPGGVAHSHIGVVASGLFPSPLFQTEDEGNEDDEQFSYDASGRPVVIDPGVLIPVYVVLPDPSQVPMPPEGYPVLIWQHGFSSSRIEVWDFGDALAEKGFALLAIDAVTHSSRFPGAQDTKNNLDRPGFLGDPSVLDGIADTVSETAVQLAFFENLLNLAGFRDNLRQTIVDLMALGRLVREPSLDLSALSGPDSPFSGAEIKLNPEQLFYYGESFGGIVGAEFVSLEPTIKGAALNVPGGALLIDTFPGSAVIGGQLLPALELFWLLPETFRFVRDDLFLQLAQGILDGGDPIVYAPHAIREPFFFGGVKASPKNLLLVEVIGDELIANVGTEALAKAFGVSLASPFYPGGPFRASGDQSGLPICQLDTGECDQGPNGVTAVLLQESPATHGANLSGHSGVLTFAPGFPFADPKNIFPLLPAPVTVANPLEPGAAMLAQFFSELRDGSIPSLFHPAPPRADFDDDGASDTVDTDPVNPFIQ